MAASRRMKLLSGIFILLAITFTVSSLLAMHANREIEHAFETRLRLSSAMYELNLAADSLTRWLRVAAITGNEFQRNAFWAEIERNRVGQALETFLALGAPNNEIYLLEQIVERRSLIHAFEQEVFRLRAEGFIEAAIAMAHHPEMTALGIPLSGMVDHLIELTHIRTQETVDAAMRRAAIFRAIMQATSLLFALSGIYGLIIISRVETSRMIKILALMFAVIAGINVFFATSVSRLSREESETHELHIALNSAVFNAELSTESLMRWVRLFVVTGGENWYNFYRSELEQDRFGEALDTFISLQASDYEVNILVDLVSRITTLRHMMDVQIIHLRTAGYTQEAIDMAFGTEIAAVGIPIGYLSVELRDLISERIQGNLSIIGGNYDTFVILIIINSSLHGILGLIWFFIGLKKSRRAESPQRRSSYIVRRFNKALISSKLAASFALVIVIFLLYVAMSVYFSVEIDNLHYHNINSLTVRIDVLSTYHQEFTEMRRLLRASFMNSEWLAQSNEGIWRSYEQRVNNSHARLMYLADSYIDLIRADYRFPERPSDSRIYAISEVVAYTNMIYDSFKDNFFLSGNMSFEQGNVANYAVVAEIMLQLLRRMAVVNQETVMSNIEQYRTSLNNLTSFTLALVLLLSFSLAYLVVTGFNRRIKAVEASALLVEQGEFEAAAKRIEVRDEISKVFAGMTAVFMRLIDEITAVSREHALGNMQTRIDTESFQGGYQKAALVINNLIDTVMEQQEKVQIAQDNSQAKSKFLARMSHEIRTPITAVMGISEIQLQDPDLPPVIEESFAKIHNSASLLLGIINDILDFSKIEAGKMEIVQEEYQLATMIHDIAHLHLAYLEKYSISFHMYVDENIPACLIGDALRIEQIVHNLLSNAFKYTESGKVELHFSCERLELEDSLILILSVKDTGLGMTAEQVDELYTDYMRFHEHEVGYVAGAGLGMPIVYNLVYLMDAEIDIKSEVGSGTIVEIRIPQKIGSSEILGRETAQRLQEFKSDMKSTVKRLQFVPESMPYGNVLVVDDVEANLYVAQGLLAFYDLNISCCNNGYEAIEKLRQGNVYDLILMDYMMPGLDGLETMQSMRKMGYNKAIVALTANALIGQAEEFIKQGFDGFVSKPIQSRHLNTILLKYIRDSQPSNVIKAANREAANTDKNKAKAADIANFQNRPDVIEKLRSDFARSQKNVFSEIAQALDENDEKTAHRLAHSLKGMAALIKEGQLMQIAAELEQSLAAGKAVLPAQMKVLEKELSKTLASIAKDTSPSATSPSATKPFDKSIALPLLDKLNTFLKSQDAECLSLLDELSLIPETAVLSRQIEDFEFDAALATATVLRDIFEENTIGN